MSVLIRGIDMPKEQTLNSFVIFPSGYVAIYNKEGSLIGKAKAFPVSLHGNLIEKHDVFKLIQAFPEIDKLLTVEFMTALYNLPTIIPAEESK